MKKCIWILAVQLLCGIQAFAQQTDAEKLFIKLRQKIDAIKDYEANVKMKIDIAYMRVPPLNGKLYFKAPDKMKLERNGGISILPKRSTNMALGNLMPNQSATVIDAGTETINGKQLRVIKVVPNTEQGDIVLTKIWIDEQRVLAMRTETTTRENGTIKMDLEFGKYEKQGLPDKVIFYIDTKEFKIPKGVTMDYDGATKADVEKAASKKPKKGRIQIEYMDYTINKGLPDAIFAENKK